MLHRLLALALLYVAFGLSGARTATAASAVSTINVAVAVTIRTFDTEAAAQTHCPRDAVAWLNLPTGIYHEKGMRWYGRTKYGAFVCRKEADAAGYRDTKNGQ